MGLHVRRDDAATGPRAADLDGSPSTARKWYVVRTVPGHEEKARLALLQRIREQRVEHRFGDVLVPTEAVVETRRGKRQVVRRVRMPGYLFVEMEMDERLWWLVRGTRKVTGFVGDRTPLEVPEAQIREVREAIVAEPKPSVAFQVGATVRVLAGPFAGYSGEVVETHPAKQRLKVLIPVFGRPTPIDLDASAVERG
jgi:transcriptional antiterminator NusG